MDQRREPILNVPAVVVTLLLVLGLVHGVRAYLLSDAADRALVWTLAFVPARYDGSILVDGGLVNNLPGDVMRERACRTLIVVDVGSEHEFTFNLPEFPSPWQFLRSRILPFAARMSRRGTDDAPRQDRGPGNETSIQPRVV